MLQLITKPVSIVFCLFLLVICDVSLAVDGDVNAFDTDSYIDTDQLERGMVGYGLTVFKGTEIEKFDVELVSVLRNYKPGRNAFLIRCKDPRFDLAKGVQGVSGSPVFFKGKLAGAMAFGWAFGEEPLYGCTSIRSMLKTQEIEKTDKTVASAGDSGRFHFSPEVYTNMMRDKLLDSKQLGLLCQGVGFAGGSQDELGRGACLPVAVTLNGFNSSAVKHLGEQFPDFKFQAGLPSGGGAKVSGAAVKLQRGSAVVVPLITGDMSAAVLGTVTEVVGDQVFAFGHPWNSNGRVDWPMGTGYVHTIVSSKNMSFKLGTLIDIVGTLKVDEGPAVYGRVGASPVMAGMTVNVFRPLISERRQFKMKVARDEQITPSLVSMVLSGAVLHRGDMPNKSHLDYEVVMRFTDKSEMRFKNTSGSRPLNEMIMDVMSGVGIVIGNPWQEVQLADIEVNVTIHDNDISAQIISTHLEQRIFKPGQVVKGKVKLMTYRDKEVDVDFSLALSGDLPDGKYEVNVGSYDKYRMELGRLQKHRFSVYKYDQLVNILEERYQIGRKNIYITMALPRVSLAIEGKLLEALPASKAMLITDRSRKMATTKYQKLNTKIVPIDYISMSNASFVIEVRR